MILTLCVDKQPKTNPSSELKTCQIEIGNRLCSKDNVYDELVIKLNDVNQLEGYIKRRCSIDRLDVITVLPEEQIQTLDIPEITLFEGTNYVYLQEFDNLNMKIEYLTNVEMNKHFAKTEEFNSTMTLTAQEFNLKISKKLDGTEFTHAKIVAKINDDTSEAQIEADKIDIKATDVLNILAGNSINLTTKNMTINSTNFNVDKDGNTTMKNATLTGGEIKSSNYVADTSGTKINLTNGVIDSKNFKVDSSGSATMKNASITGGSITLSGDNTTPRFRINSSVSDDRYTEYLPNSIRMFRDGIANVQIQNLMNAAGFVAWDYADTNKQVQVCSWFIQISDATQRTTIEPGKITTPILTQTSLEEHKKNFEKLDNALDIIKNIDIYKYNMKTDNDTDKKHIGFVIGDKFNYSKEITSKENDGVDIYSFVSVCCKAIQEQQEQINELQEKIKRLESDK